MTNILDLKMEPNDANADTVRTYLKKLLLMVWQKDESFSGKRPFGNSGWKYDIYNTLAIHGVIQGEIDEDGDVDIPQTEYPKADALISDAIKAL